VPIVLGFAQEKWGWIGEHQLDWGDGWQSRNQIMDEQETEIRDRISVKALLPATERWNWYELFINMEKYL
jgi:hypothetical protein